MEHAENGNVMKTIVLGAAGYMGQLVCAKLNGLGHEVISLAKSGDQAQAANTTSWYNVLTGATPLNLSNRDIGAVFWCVGHCPRGGMKDVVRPLLNCSPNEVADDYALHALGVVRVMRDFLPTMVAGGHFVVLSSRADRLLELEKYPRHIQIYNHVAAIRAQKAYLVGARRDPNLIAAEVSVDIVSVPMIRNSPFHQDSQALGESVTGEEARDALVGCLDASTNQTIDTSSSTPVPMPPSPPAAAPAPELAPTAPMPPPAAPVEPGSGIETGEASPPTLV